MKKYSNHKQREIVMQAIFQIITYVEDNLDYNATDILLEMYNVDTIDDCPAFSQLLYVTILDNYNQIKQIISDNLINWDFNRLSKSTKAILFTAIGEGKYLNITPRNVVINEAIELAKNYSDIKDYKFVNGILDKVL